MKMTDERRFDVRLDPDAYIDIKFINIYLISFVVRYN